MHLLGNRAGKVHAAAVVIAGHVRKDAALVLPHMQLGRRATRPLAARPGAEQLHDAISLGIGQRLEQHRIHNGKDRGIGPDPQRQG